MAFLLYVWGAAAVTAGLGYLVNAFKPAPAAPTGAAGIISSIPIWGWIVVGLVLLVLIMKK